MKVAVLGGGIAGLISGWLLNNAGIDFKVFESQPYYGGLARSFDWHGFKCDIASHRLFTKDKKILEKLLSIIPLLKHNRNSKIFIGGKWIKDPVNPIELIIRFFPNPGINFIKDYFFKEKLDGRLNESFDTYVLGRYGKGLNQFFFKPYTEKLFGINADQVSVKWAEQKVRVSGFLDMIKKNTKIYFNYFYYPKEGGYGAFADKFYQEIKDKVFLHAPVKVVHRQEDRISAITYAIDQKLITEHFDAVISTIPITILGEILNFKIDLHFRPVKLIYLLMDSPHISDSHWVYFGQKDIIINRMGEIKNFSSYGVPEDKTVLCCEITMEYPEKNLTEKVIDDLNRIGFINKNDVLDTMMIKEDYGYPIYNLNFMNQVASTAQFFSSYKNLFLLGRNAEFRHKEVDEIFGSAIDLVNKLKRIDDSVDLISILSKAPQHIR